MSNLERELLLLEKQIRHFHSDVPLKENQWKSLYFYLFDQDEPLFIVDDKELTDTVMYLHDIISANSFGTIAELMDFYESKKMELQKFLHAMFKETGPSAN